MNNTKKLASTTFVAAVAVLVVATISPYFYDTVIDEAIPTASAALPQGQFVGVGDGIHDAQGMAKIIQVEDGTEYLRLENFKSTNGPDLYVYLATDENASEYVDLGRLKGNVGNQNYEIPQGTDLSKYDKVLIWCKSFSVLFGSAELTESGQ
ncbi:MAG: DM13 domain-containing protein [Nitrosopumilus sp.]